MNERAEKKDPLLRVENLTVSYPVKGASIFQKSQRQTAVKDVSLTLNQGESLAIVGESGSGKSTLLRTICGLVEADQGNLFLRNEVWPLSRSNRNHTFRKRVQMIFQDPFLSLDPRQKVASILKEAMGLHFDWEAEKIRKEIDQLLDWVDLDHESLGRYPHAFSGGQKQRIGIARALAVHPDVLLCDEPVSALDVSVQAQILNLLDRLKRELGLSLIFVTHDLAVAEWISDRIVVMKDGQTIEENTSENFHRLAKDPYSRKLIESVPDLDIHGIS